MNWRRTAPIVATTVCAFALAGAYGYRTYEDARLAESSDRQADRSSTEEASVPPREPISIDPRRQQLIGVRIVSAVRAPIGASIRATGIVAYDETKQSDVNIKVEGWIRQLYVDATGQAVQKGQALFTLYSPELLNTEREYLLALATRDQMKDSPVPDVHDRAEALIAAARQRLALWDVSDADIRTLEASKQASDSVVFRSPVDGFVIDKHAIAGMHVMPGDSLYRVASLMDVWVEADVYETDIANLRPGAPADVTLDAYPGHTFAARIVYIYPYLDQNTRANKVRFELPNGRGRLKPGMYAHVEVKTTGGQGIVVPTDAVLDSGTDQVVFIAQGDGMFEPRKVKVGRRLEDTTEITDGLKEGDRVATGATFFLDSESQLRAAIQSYQASSSVATPASSGSQLDISLRTQPDPPRTGDTQFEIVVKDPSGNPIEDADVRVQLFMPAMPTMNMPAMQNETKLAPAGRGVYRGTGQILMSGKWNATVVVSRGGQRLGSRQLAVVAQ